MEHLRVIGTEDEDLIVATDAGDRFRLPVDEVLRAQMRRARRADPEPRPARPGPREIQSHIRAGLSAQEVASLLGARVEDVERYEGPVLAEREHIVGQALAVPVLLSGDLEHDALPTFGAAVRAKLVEAGATSERWGSWKEDGGWVVKLEFTAADVEHDARWGFDPRRSTLSPLNADAVQLSRQGSLPDGLIPRLRALDTPVKDETRFDSGAFGPRREPAIEPDPEPRVAATAVQDAAMKRAPEPASASSETADLLEALRRRRGQREPAPGPDSAASASNSPVALFDALEPGYDEIGPPPDAPDRVEDRAAVPDAARRRGRSSMPSWDEIVFGARTED